VGLSACANVRIAISGVECIFGMNWSLPEVQPWVQTIFELFGTKRVMFGSDRPICGLSSTFPTPYRAYEKMTDGLSLSEEDAVFRLNAADWFFGGSPLSKGTGLDAPL
jgi:predicted TIM-barrel fold metal-dependent hydrolase